MPDAMPCQDIAPHSQAVLRLPDDILLQIFSYFLPDGHEQDAPTSSYALDTGCENGRVLKNSRLACRALDAIVTPLLFRKLHVSLSVDSLRNFQSLASNPLIRESVRGVEINLRFHSRLLTSDIATFHRGQAAPVLDSAERECDWHTEFANYDPDDQSEDAVKTRAYHEAWPQLGATAYNWKKYVKKASQLEAQAKHLSLASAPKQDHDVTNDVESTNAVDDNVNEYDEMEYWGDSDGDEDYDEHTRILLDGFESYVTKHAEEARMINDQSFARTIASALSGYIAPISIWFNDSEPTRNRHEYGALELVEDWDLLRVGISAPRKWNELESLQGSDGEEDLLMPARLLADVPIACHEAGVRIKTLHVHCFPLNKSFGSLIPSHARSEGDKKHSDPWTRFAAACHDLTSFDFNASNNTPLRYQRLPQSDAVTMNGYIAAAVSSPRLELCDLSFCCYRVNDGRSSYVYGRRETPKIEDFYLAAPILSSIVSRELRRLTIMYVEVDSAALQNALRGLHPAQLNWLYLCDVVLTDGRWLDVTTGLHDLLASRSEDGTKPRIMLTSLRGVEFGAATAFEEGDPLFAASEEERDGFWKKLEEHHHPPLLKALEEWVTSDRTGEPNPLATLWEKGTER